MVVIKLLICLLFLLPRNQTQTKGDETDGKELIQVLMENIPLNGIWETYVYNNSTSTAIVKSALEILPTPYIVISKAVDFKLCTKYLSYNDKYLMLLLIENAENALSIVRDLIEHKLVVARSKIIVLCLEHITPKQLLEIYERLWNFKIGNLKYIGMVNGSVNSYIFDPFHLEETTGLQTSNYFYLDKKINMNRKTLYVSITESFPQSFRFKYQGQVIWTGRSIQKVQMLAMYCNATVFLVFPKDSVKQCIETIKNCTYATMSPGLENDMVSGKSEISLSYRHVLDSMLLDYIQAYETESMRLVKPAAGIIPTYVTLVRIFSWRVYAKAFVCLLLTVFTLHFTLMRKTRRNILGYLFFRVTFRLTGQLSRIEIIESGHVIGKIVLKLWDFFCMVLLACFTTYVISALIYPERYKNIKDSETFLNANPTMPVYGFASLYHVINASNNYGNSSVFKKVMKRYTIVNAKTFYEHAYYTPYNKSLIVYGEVAVALKVLLKWVARGEDIVHISDPLVRARVSLMTVRGSIYHKFFERMIIASHESGIEMQLLNKAKYFLTRPKLMVDHKALGMDQFYPPFLILIIGHILAIIIFVCEHCWYRYTKKFV